MDMELELGLGDEISIELDTNSISYEIIEEIKDER